jgi:hypothetical protein
MKEQAALLKKIKQEEARVERESRKRSRRRREKGRLESARNFSVGNSKKEKLQPPKKLYNYPKRVRE